MGKCELGISKSIRATKAMKMEMYDNLGSALYLWFQQQHEKRILVNGPILLKKISGFHRLFYVGSPKPFKASYGFQWHFCKGIWNQSLAIAEEKASMDNVSADKLISSFNTLMDKSSLDQIFNCDETGLLYKMLPGCTLTTIHNDPSRTKKSKGTCNY